MTTPPEQSRQLEQWRGAFGHDYRERNQVTEKRLHERVKVWARVLGCMDGAPPQSILEVGANVGLVMRALRRLTDAELFAVEPNAESRQRLVTDGVLPATHALDGFAAHIPLPDKAVDLAFTSGVMIHIHPDHLLASCKEIHRVSRRYIACIEYFSDKPETIHYRGHDDLLFKRDFGGFWMDNFSDLQVVDYGFFWKRLTGLDNPTWWVFEKRM
ncbi:MAG: methyltransferase domain-containing protein [Magnetococcales bacterium]|nr:methyltransferase domain-containing protein [Magnetococcales bacterium]MBF0322566.1 methyltransferase domain-containing protein [Magnetococcales bacterium]